VEISTKGNAGFIYDEARRGWLSKDRSNEEARQAFKKNKWNEFRVLCAGDSIKTWVNGVPVAHVVDSMTPRGFIGLQVHGFKGDPPAWVQWRNVRIKELKVGSTTETLKVVVVTGGHGFEREPFLKIFDEIKEINYVESVQKDHSELFEDISTFDKGVGVVALHHTMGAYQEWPEFKRIIGTKYYLKDAMEGGVLRKQGSYKHDLDVKVHVKDKKHPITKGMSDFTIHDETYKNCWFDKNNQLLLTTDHATSDETIGWVRQYSKAKVCTIQLGHDSKAYSNSNYRQLVKRAILWTAGKL
jgi:type 1 glutamine amidotransferase